jgi:hypothetical protein
MSGSQDKQKKPIIEIIPSFFLKGIDPTKVIHEYLNGEIFKKALIIHNINNSNGLVSNGLISNNDIGSSRKVNVASSSGITLIPEYDKSAESETYSYIDKSNIKRIVTTSNHTKYSLVRDGKPLSKGVKCSWCRLRVEDHPGFDKENGPIGIPLKFELAKINGVYLYIFHCDQDDFGTFECAFALFKFLNPPTYAYRNPVYMDSEKMLRLLYSLAHPNGEQLKAADDWRLLGENGGPIEKNEFFKGTHTYRQTPNIILLPAKIEYLYQKN